MKYLVIVCLLAVASANPQFIHPYAAIPAAPVVAAAPAVTSSQYHSQDELGQFSYGYAGGPSAKHELRTADGITRGGYSYVDAHGLVQSVDYVSDPVNGFRAAATNLPVAPTPVDAHIAAASIPDSPDVAVAKAAHFAAHAEAVSRLARSKRQILAPYAYSAGYPIIAAAPAVGLTNKYHSQDELGQYSYGYNDGLSSKHETRAANGVTQGGYSYVDSHGLVQTVQYTADPVHGFRVAATNLP